MQDWRTGMVTPADRAEKSAEKQMERLDRLEAEFQQYRNEAKSEANRTHKVVCVTLAVNILALIVAVVVAILK